MSLPRVIGMPSIRSRFADSLEGRVPRHRFTAAAALSLALVTLVAACGNDDGADVRNIGEECASGSASGSGSAYRSDGRSRSNTALRPDADQSATATAITVAAKTLQRR